MTKAKEILINAIINDGEVSGEIVKVDKTLNHMVDIKVIKAIARRSPKSLKMPKWIKSSLLRRVEYPVLRPPLLYLMWTTSSQKKEESYHHEAVLLRREFLLY